MQKQFILLGSMFGILVLTGFGCVPKAIESEYQISPTAGGEIMESGDEMMEKKDGDAMESGDEMMEKKDGDAMESGDEMMEKKDDDAMEASGSMEKPEETAAAPGSYEAYDAAKLARAEDGSVVLFFHASWCPSCRGLESNIQANLGNIPDGITILKTDYDTQTELKKKYGVTYQHTLVQVDANGNMIKKWSGGATLESLVDQIQS